MAEPSDPTLIRRARLEDWPAIERFLAANYGSEAPFKHHARWLWQFVRNPFHLEGSADPTVWIALEDGQVIGQLAVQDGQVRIASRTYPAGWLVDLMVDPRARGRGLGHALHRAIMAERPLLMKLTMAPATRRIADRAGALTLAPVSEYILPTALSGATVSHLLASRAEARRSRKPMLARALDLAARMPAAPAMAAAAMRAAARVRRRATAGDGRIEEVDRIGAAADALWDRLASRFPASFARTSEFLDWRFGKAPDLPYRKFILRRGGNPVGWLVTRAAHPAEPRMGVLVDMFADPEDGSALAALVAHAVDMLSPATEYIRAAASTPAFRRALANAGFLRVRTHRPTVACSDPGLRATIALMKDLWHFTKGDHDWDQLHPEDRAGPAGNGGRSR